MDRIKLVVQQGSKKAEKPKATVTKNHEGVYRLTSKNYSRQKCLDTMVALDPWVRIIYISLNGKRHEVAHRSYLKLVKGHLVFHFSAHWKLETVEAKMPDPPPPLPRRHQRVEKEVQ